MNNKKKQATSAHKKTYKNTEIKKELRTTKNRESNRIPSKNRKITRIFLFKIRSAQLHAIV